MKSVDPFPRLLHAFFYEWMVQQRNASVHTVRSYRDTWRLFLRFVAHRQRRTVAQLGLAELTASEVSAFLQPYRAGTPRHDRYAQLPSRRAAQLSSALSPAGSQPRSRSAPKSCTFPRRRRRSMRRPIWSRRRSRPFWPSLISRRSKANATMRSLPSFTIPARASRKRSMCVRRRSGLTRPPVCALRQGAERAAVPAVAGNGIADSIAASTPAESRRRTDLRQSLRCPVGPSGVRFRLAEYVEAAAKIVPSLASKHVTSHSFRHATAVHRCSGSRHHGDQKLARARQPRHHQPLCAGQSGDQTKSPRAPRQTHPDQASHRHGSTTRACLRGSIRFRDGRNNVKETAYLSQHRNGNGGLLHVICSC